MPSPTTPTLEDIATLNSSLNRAIANISDPRRRQSAQKTAYLLGAINDPMLAITQEELDREMAIRVVCSSLEGGPAHTSSWTNSIGPDSVTSGTS